MVHVTDGGHCVDLEVLVGAEGAGILNWSPVGEARFTIVEPLVAKLAHISGIEVRDSLCDLRAGYTSVQVKHLWSNLLHGVAGRLDTHKLVPGEVAGSHNLNFVDIITIEGRHGNSSIVHLPGENFISK